MIFDSHLWTALSEKVGLMISDYIVELHESSYRTCCVTFNRSCSWFDGPLHEFDCRIIAFALCSITPMVDCSDLA